MIGLGGRRSHGTRAVVTGAGSGIGAAFARELASRDGTVVCADIDEDAAGATAAAIEASGGKALAVRCDVAAVDDVIALGRAARAWFAGPASFVVNNAGVGAGGVPVGEVSIEEWRHTLGVNLYGVIHGCHAFVPQLREAGHGGLVNVASAASFSSAPGMAAYNVSKAGVVSLSETLAAELSGTGVRVSVLCPTFVKTNILDGAHIAPDSAALARRLMSVVGMSADRVARTCLDAHDRGQLYILPQLDAKAFWRVKRAAPAAFTRGAGLLGRALPH